MARVQQTGHAILAFWSFTLNYRQFRGVGIEEVVIAVVVGVQQRSNKDRRVEHGQRGKSLQTRWKRSRKANKVHKAYVLCNSDPTLLVTN